MSLPREQVEAQKMAWDYLCKKRVCPRHFITGGYLQMLFDEIDKLKKRLANYEQPNQPITHAAVQDNSQR